jgi:biotin carboxyl carrier protein
MKHKIRGKNFEQTVECRDALNQPNGGSLYVNNTRHRVEWRRNQSVAFVRSADSELERVVRYLAIDREAFAGEPEAKFKIHLPLPGGAWAWTNYTAVTDAPGQDQRAAASKSAGTTLRSPMTGKILQILKKAGDQVREGEVMMIIEAMKMENKILAPFAGEITKLNGEIGRVVNTGDVLIGLKPTNT